MKFVAALALACLFVAAVAAKPGGDEEGREKAHQERMARFEERRKEFDSMRDGSAGRRSTDMVCDACKEIVTVSAEKLNEISGGELAAYLDEPVCEDINSRYHALCRMITEQKGSELSERVAEGVDSQTVCIDVDYCDRDDVSESDRRRNSAERMRQLYRSMSDTRREMRGVHNAERNTGDKRAVDDRIAERQAEMERRRAEMEVKRKERNEALRSQLEAAGAPGDIDIDSLLKDRLGALGGAGGGRTREEMEERLNKLMSEGRLPTKASTTDDVKPLDKKLPKGVEIHYGLDDGSIHTLKDDQHRVNKGSPADAAAAREEALKMAAAAKGDDE